ncbi:hypothetical protein FEM48_Zijuj04G0198300 [Ziziphus jujuba var. spinosa]|uniref:Uncharacterized protein n=1 Tax=Ziziphus jujuba var. spinosa TaxID=714518 RepID=A0A978VLV0_ZIZJJ|nr:hypothetical protein FEM48_Zijuj04G0198300 [Ziziphus jujuba var. spinosa]
MEISPKIPSKAVRFLSQNFRLPQHHQILKKHSFAVLFHRTHSHLLLLSLSPALLALISHPSPASETSPLIGVHHPTNPTKFNSNTPTNKDAMLSKKTKLRIRRVPSSRDRLQPVMVSKKKARSRTLLSSRERDKPIMNLIFTWSHNDTYFHPGWEAVVQSLNDPSIDLSAADERLAEEESSGNFSTPNNVVVLDDIDVLSNMIQKVLSNNIQKGVY